MLIPIPIGKSFVLMPVGSSNNSAALPLWVSIPCLILDGLILLIFIVCLIRQDFDDIYIHTILGLLLTQLVIMIIGFILTCLGVIQ